MEGRLSPVFLVFDTETNGLARRGSAPQADLANWPRLVQIGWILCDEAGRIADSHESIVKPEGFSIARAAAQVHGITTERALAEGVKLRTVLEAFRGAVEAAEVLVAHNLRFDMNVVAAEFLRTAMPNPLRGKRRRCTMEQSAEYCRLPGAHGYKWPTLTELHQKLFGEPFAGAHGALADAMACMRCFFRLRELGVIRCL